MSKTNILFFLIPKQKVTFVYDDYTLAEALEAMKTNRYSAIPILSRDNHYVGTLSEGDILWKVKSIPNFNFDQADKIKISELDRLRDNDPVNVNSNMEILISRATNENFVPVLDDDNQFLGIITRKQIINYFFEHKFIVL